MYSPLGAADATKFPQAQPIRRFVIVESPEDRAEESGRRWGLRDELTESGQLRRPFAVMLPEPEAEWEW